MLSLGVFVFSHVLFCKLAGSADRRNVRGKSDVRIAEGSNADLRHCIAGLRRRSRCFFWRLVTLRAVLWVFANAVRRGQAQVEGAAPGMRMRVRLQPCPVRLGDMILKLAKILAPVFGEYDHVDLLGLTVPARDTDIWDYASKNGFTIITKDSDFLDMLELKGFPPKVILVKTGNNSSKALANLLTGSKSKIEDMEHSESSLLEIIRVAENNKMNPFGDAR